MWCGENHHNVLELPQFHPQPLPLPLRAACNNSQPVPAPAVLVQATILAWRGREKVRESERSIPALHRRSPLKTPPHKTHTWNPASPPHQRQPLSRQRKSALISPACLAPMPPPCRAPRTASTPNSQSGLTLLPAAGPLSALPTHDSLPSRPRRLT